MSGTATIRKVIDTYMETFETGFPGTVSEVNSDGTIDALPSVRNCLTNLQQEAGGGTVQPMRSIPVLWPGTANAIVKFSLSAGDPVWLVSGSRDQSEWADGDWADAASDPFRAPSFGGNDLNSLVAIPVRRETHGSGKPKVTVTIGDDGKVTIEGDSLTVSADSVMLDADSVKVTGNLAVEGDIDSDGTVTGKTDVKGGLSGISLIEHVHTTTNGMTGKPEMVIPQ